MIRRSLLLATIALTISFSAAEAKPPSPSEMANRIDLLLRQSWDDAGLKPAEPATDAEFLRRAWLDICGIIPPINDDDGVSGIRGFLKRKDPDKRRRLIESLLKKPRHATHFANIWKRAMLPEDTNVVRRFGGETGFQTWLRGQFADNVPYNRLVTDLLLAEGAANQTGPALYYTALQLKPEELAASTSRIFLGVQIQCAQCHDHPFDHWKRKDFWGYAAFFARLQRPTNTRQVSLQVTDARSGEVRIPETKEIVRPKFLDGDASLDSRGPSRRVRLAAWLTSKDNPYFARAAVNRVWAQMFGRGIVDPVDDLGEHNAPTHPELLDELAQYFVEIDYDLDQLIRTLSSTRAYQLSSRSQAGDDAQPQLFERMAIKSLSAEQLYDCLAEATRRRESTNSAVISGASAFDPARIAFLAKFRAPTQGSMDYQSGIPQALTLMNGSMIRQATDLNQSDLLVGLNAPFFNDRQRIETLFLSTLSRPPSDEERETFTRYVEEGGAENDRKKALGDVLWALLNSAEFILNH